MIPYKVHDNGWTVIIEDFNLKSATQNDINQIAKLIATSTCVVIKNQFLTIDDELKILKMFRNPDKLLDSINGDTSNWTYKALVADMEKDPEGIILRITGERRDGLQGGASWKREFDWHCNQPEYPIRKSIVWLYGVRGTKGSRTSWTNSILAYNDLDNHTKERISHLHSIYGNFKTPDESQWRNKVKYNTSWTPSLIHKNIANKTGMYFSPLQIQKFVELSVEESNTLKNQLFNHILNEKYVYHHDWQDGDIVISEQWLGIHKRWPFEDIETRLVHRAAVDFPEQDYSNI